MPRIALCTTPRRAVATGPQNPLVDPRPGAPVASGAMTSTTRTPGALTVGPLRPVILKLAAPAVAMMACHFCFNLIDAIWVGRLIGPAALAAVSTAGFYVWVLLSLGEMVEVGLIAVAARRHGEGRPDTAARAAGAAVLYALGGHGREPARPFPDRRPVSPHGRARGGGAARARLSAHLAAGRAARVRLFRGRGDLPGLGRHAHAVPHPHRLGTPVDRARPAAHRGVGAIHPARRGGRGDGVGDGAGGRLPDRSRDRPAARADPARRPRLAGRPDHRPRGRAAVARGRAFEPHLHVVDAVHVAVRHSRAG